MTRFHGLIETQAGRLRVRERLGWTVPAARKAAGRAAARAEPTARVAGVTVSAAAARELTRRRAKLAERLGEPLRG